MIHHHIQAIKNHCKSIIGNMISSDGPIFFERKVALSLKVVYKRNFESTAFGSSRMMSEYVSLCSFI
jgi:hypothetical protein